MIESVVKKIHWEVSLFCEKVIFSTYFCIFHCFLPVPTPQYTIMLGQTVCCLSHDVKSAWHRIGAQGAHLSCLNSGIME